VTEVAFHFGAPDKVAYVCRLLRKAVGAGAKVVVVTNEVDLPRLDADLWAMSPTEFLPHAVATHQCSG
jgi:DNA polymerase-3 subunit chi